MRALATMVFVGAFVPESFAEFMRHRAARLSIEARPRRIEPERIEVEVEGEPDLVDMFEMACSLGPIDCLVLEVERTGSRG
ncbi:hypothetical protein C3941_18585 [Kaistia algarum]|uniref:hypothetical protein n=1 Tax=Kaistia algarum TaxID=2083279 RepID=UPI000CE8725B|nr:hypothetical protein [Kaistia algarum]MCX5516548.1 hypothetical protein [Kaistia algarum]PPE78340.1 hypothetical protein C3941_18585 [Kaistia algarum]